MVVESLVQVNIEKVPDREAVSCNKKKERVSWGKKDRRSKKIKSKLSFSTVPKFHMDSKGSGL